MLVLHLDNNIVLTRVFTPVQLKGDGIVHYYLNRDCGLVQGLKRLTEITPKQAYEIIMQYQDKEGAKKFLRSINNEGQPIQ